MRKLAIITTHPIQYNAPVFKMLSERGNITAKVFYTWGEQVTKRKFDPGFNKVVEWDIPLLEGYDYEFVENKSNKPGSDHYWGIQNPGLIHLINEWKADAILVIGWNFASHLKVLRHFKNNKTILFRGDSVSLREMGFLKSIVRKALLKFVYSHVDYALFVGKNNYNYYIEAGLQPNQLIKALHAIDNDRFSESAEQSKKLIRNQVGISDDQFVFLYAGKFESIKNPEIILEAFKKFNGIDDASLLMVGNGPLENKLKEQAQSLRNVHFLDFQNQKQMPAVYAAGDTLILSSRSETWGLAVNEAMACGVPSIISDTCGCAVDLIIEGKTGYVFQEGNVESLYEKMMTSYSARYKKSDIVNSCKEHINQFRFEGICQAIESVVSNVR